MLLQFILFTQVLLFLRGVAFVGPRGPLQQGVPALELGKFVAGPSYPSIANVNERGTLMAE